MNLHEWETLHHEHGLCGEGWWPIIDMVLAEIRLICGHHGLDPENEDTVYISDIKEKWGDLNIYMMADARVYDRIEAAIDRATAESQRTCMLCGYLGTIKKVRGWYTAICQDCEEEMLGNAP